MKRAIFVALGTGAVITSAAALTVGTPSLPASLAAPHDELGRARLQSAARQAHRENVEARYLAARARCETLGGVKRDHCFIKAHAFRGRALLEEHQPYTRN